MKLHNCIRQRVSLFTLLFIIFNTNAVLAKSVYISNFGFESGIKGWSVTGPAKPSTLNRTGDFSIKLAGQNARISRKVSVKENTNYEFTVFVRGNALIGVNLGSSNVGTSKETPGGWEKLTVGFNSGANKQIQIFAAYKDVNSYIDNVKLKAVSKNYLVTSAASKPVEKPAKKDLDPSLPPSGNFELIDWKLSVPTDVDNNGKADTIKEKALASGYNSEQFFYTQADGAMVFKVPVEGFKTSKNTSYTRVELREMLRRGDTKHKTKGVGKNNWVFSSAPAEDQKAAGGVDGKLTGTVAINRVTTTGSSKQVGRVVFAQIHANKDEPIRFYYRKLPNNDKGSIYFAHEPLEKKDIYTNMIGSRSSKQENPEDGIALGEKFSYEINVFGNGMTVKLFREGKKTITKTVNMSESGYDQGDQYMYFKAGAYLQDNTGEADDYAEVAYYELHNSH